MSSLVLLLATSLDYLLADPQNWLHPVQIMGFLIKVFSQKVIEKFPQKAWRRFWGIILGLGLIVGSTGLSWLIIKLAQLVHPLLGLAVEVILLASCLAGRSLHQAAQAVLKPLEGDNLFLARQTLSQYVGRDTENLNEQEILKACLETVAENTTDGATAPLFYAFLGALIPGIGPVPLAMGYKAASTLDSMVGYLREPYIDLGWFSAKLEDALTWLPCRLTVLSLTLMSGKPLRVWRLCCRDGPVDPSPNSGWSEAVYSAILGVQLGGVNYYGGVKKVKPLLGEPEKPITVTTIREALNWLRALLLLWLAIALLILSV